jgi:hypothetical protein
MRAGDETRFPRSRSCIDDEHADCSLTGSRSFDHAKGGSRRLYPTSETRQPRDGVSDWLVDHRWHGDRNRFLHAFPCFMD